MPRHQNCSSAALAPRALAIIICINIQDMQDLCDAGGPVDYSTIVLGGPEPLNDEHLVVLQQHKGV